MGSSDNPGGKMANLTVANTILKQMGGAGKLSAMVSAHDFVGDKDSLQFGFKGSRKANKCRVILDPTDTYTLEFWKYNKRTFDIQQVGSFEGLYADMLKPVFESETGLYLSL